MIPVFLLIEAPFAAFRPFQSGSYRSTTSIPSPSTVYGILLNLAGIEQRAATDQDITLIKDDLPTIEIAIGIPHLPNKPKTEIATLSQQLHSYPVGDSGKELAKKTHGNKYWIAPVRREVIINFRLIVGVKANQDLCNRIIEGLNGELKETRYGIPFAGDNNFFFDNIEVINRPPCARWYCHLDKSTYPERGICRLTTWINRADNTKTKIGLFYPTDFVLDPPESAWSKLPSNT
ncbi:MAG: type I-MYXAN CRISPR-associated protein Cas5/Cmx5/DevS [Cylindrospermopsis raciborskii]|jgi:CRISPR-associated protein Cas5t|uniref:type I-MYXAN CRISPR-associated protein Cas5/Cmx5/DevS n=1 Tax=Cylindrospermopsis raciborskii TaxID=77022 RepID=UPI003D0ED405